MPNPKYPPIMRTLEARAKHNASFNHSDGYWVTGHAIEGTIEVRYYPGCERYAWFDDNGPITKRCASDLLTKGLWNPPTFARVVAR